MVNDGRLEGPPVTVWLVASVEGDTRGDDLRRRVRWAFRSKAKAAAYVRARNKEPYVWYEVLPTPIELDPTLQGFRDYCTGEMQKELDLAHRGLRHVARPSPRVPVPGDLSPDEVAWRFKRAVSYYHLRGRIGRGR